MTISEVLIRDTVAAIKYRVGNNNACSRMQIEEIQKKHTKPTGHIYEEFH